MANSYIDFTIGTNASAGQTVYDNLTLDYVETTHITVIVTPAATGASTTIANADLTIETSPAFKITIPASYGTGGANALVNGDLVRINRTTPIASPLRTFQDSSVLKASDLNAQNKQFLFGLQENIDAGVGSLPIDTDNKYNAGGRNIKNVADGNLSSEVVTKSQLDAALLGFSFNEPESWEWTWNQGTDELGGRSFTLANPAVPSATNPKLFIIEVGGVIQIPTTDYLIDDTGGVYKLVLVGTTTGDQENDTKVIARNFGYARNVNNAPFISSGASTPAIILKQGAGATANTLEIQDSVNANVVEVNEDGATTWFPNANAEYRILTQKDPATGVNSRVNVGGGAFLSSVSEAATDYGTLSLSKVGSDDLSTKDAITVDGFTVKHDKGGISSIYKVGKSFGIAAQDSTNGSSVVYIPHLSSGNTGGSWLYSGTQSETYLNKNTTSYVNSDSTFTHNGLMTVNNLTVTGTLSSTNPPTSPNTALQTLTKSITTPSIIRLNHSLDQNAGSYDWEAEDVNTHSSGRLYDSENGFGGGAITSMGVATTTSDAWEKGGWIGVAKNRSTSGAGQVDPSSGSTDLNYNQGIIQPSDRFYMTINPMVSQAASGNKIVIDFHGHFSLTQSFDTASAGTREFLVAQVAFRRNFSNGTKEYGYVKPADSIWNADRCYAWKWDKVHGQNYPTAYELFPMTFSIVDELYDNSSLGIPESIDYRVKVTKRYNSWIDTVTGSPKWWPKIGIGVEANAVGVLSGATQDYDGGNRLDASSGYPGNSSGIRSAIPAIMTITEYSG